MNGEWGDEKHLTMIGLLLTDTLIELLREPHTHMLWQGQEALGLHQNPRVPSSGIILSETLEIKEPESLWSHQGRRKAEASSHLSDDESQGGPGVFAHCIAEYWAGEGLGDNCKGASWDWEKDLSQRQTKGRWKSKWKSLTCSRAFLITLPTSCLHSGMSGLNSSKFGEKDKSRDLKNSAGESRGRISH